MTEPSRRQAIGIFVGMACAAAIGGVPVHGFAQSGVAIPTGPMLLARRLERSLRGGAALSVSRSWQVEFSRQLIGQKPMIKISGIQLDVEIYAPDSLAPLAAVERSRTTDAMWPIMVNGAGRIETAGSGSSEDDIANAIAKAQEMIAARPIPDSQIEAHQQYLQAMQNAGASLLDQIPDDLFFPQEEPHRSFLEVQLPSGLMGQFEVSYEARCAPQRDWLEQAEREIVTRIGQSEQCAKEVWSLGAL